MMKKNNVWYIIVVFTIVLGCFSCERVEEFNNEPELEIAIDNKEGSAVYSFEAKTNGIDDAATMIWSVDGKDIEEEINATIIDRILDYLFEPGAHKICVRIVTEERVIEACTDIEVVPDESNPCPDLFFRSKKYERPSTYKFIANFKGADSLSYEWYINQRLVENVSSDRNNYLIWDFEEPGRYEVCIKTETPNCPEGVSYCKIIEIEEADLHCPKVSFEKEMEPGATNSYIFEAKIEGTDTVSEIIWSVNERVIEVPNDQQTGGRTFMHQFDPGVYKVCLKVITPNCPEGVVYCKEIRVENCPRLLFEAERDGNNLAYYFYPEAFEGIDDVVIGWTINGDYVGDSPEFPHNNPFYYQFGATGRYEICAMIETPDCPNGVSYCKVIEIE